MQAKNDSNSDTSADFNIYSHCNSYIYSNSYLYTNLHSYINSHIYAYACFASNSYAY